MQRSRRIIVLFLIAAAWLCSCDSTFQSSVPAYPVHVVIDTRVGEFVTFTPTNSFAHVVVNKYGVFYNEKFLFLPDATTRWGCGGVIVYVDLWGEYKAFDLCCANCASLRQECELIDNGWHAECPRCGEVYDFVSGIGNPTLGKTKEPLRKLPVSVINYTDNNKIITVHQ